MCFDKVFKTSKAKGKDMTPAEPVHGRRQEVVDELLLASNVGRSTRELAIEVGAPLPSVRRMIGELRDRGYNVIRDQNVYKLL